MEVTESYVESAERLADIAETILYTEYTLTDWTEFRDAWQAYVATAESDEEVRNYVNRSMLGGD